MPLRILRKLFKMFNCKLSYEKKVKFWPCIMGVLKNYTKKMLLFLYI
jgi:hypothetical protein